MCIPFRWITPILSVLLVAGCASSETPTVASVLPTPVSSASTAAAPSDSSTTSQPVSAVHPSLLEGQAVFDRADDMISSAKHSILLEMYELGNSREIALLEQKADSGVPVLALLDGSEKQTAKAIPELEAHHVKVQVATSPLIQKDGIQHAKMLVIDDSQVLIGGMNWGRGSVENADADVYEEGTTAKEAQSVFNADWRQLGASLPTGVTDDTISGQDILSGKPLLSAILSDLDQAKTIQAAFFELSNRELINKLTERAKAGAKVQVLLDTRMEKKINSQAAKELSSAGVQVQFYPGNQVLHAKMIITDSIVIVGSANGSASAFTRNHELDLLTSDSSVLKQAQADFETMYAK